MNTERRVGLDLGLRTKHRAVVYDGAERRGRAFGVAVNREGFDDLLRRATDGADAPVTFVMESTGLALIPVAAYVTAAGHEVNLANPQKASDLRKFIRRHTKTDVIDADACARIPVVDPDGLHPLQLPTADEMTLRRLVKGRDRLMRQVASGKRRVESLMVMANPPLMDALGGDKFGRATVAFYRKYADPDLAVRRGPEALERFWARHSKGKSDSDRAHKVYEAYRTTAELYRGVRDAEQLPFDYAQVTFPGYPPGSIVRTPPKSRTPHDPRLPRLQCTSPPPLRRFSFPDQYLPGRGRPETSVDIPQLQEELRFELDTIDHFEQQAERLQEQIEQLYVRVDPDRTLEQLRGVSSVIAPALEALVGDVSRFKNGRRFVSYCGLAPRKKRSGQSDPSMPITKAGQRLLKKYLYLAASVARQWDPDFAAYYARRYAQGDAHNRIIIALARKMALRVHALLKRRDQARAAKAEGGSADSTSYVLRDDTGREVSKKEARQLIEQRYARPVVAPERDARGRARRGKGERRRIRTEGVAATGTPQTNDSATGS